MASDTGMFQSGLIRLAFVFAANVVGGVTLGSVVGGRVGYTVEWMITGAILGIAVAVFAAQR
ncbi:hypothetical protein C440_10318 [Haloferax mucosum ATCC BAA-1512]|uniref:Uncharacterized protein n=1 Tax=Haloferax mucosum ATCC BAA-1512 TaxID=662479 RepID=M0ID96_9EURY|nr:hypothetical protein [Haloferax mucosum]ELZ94007.1 hypothetical protein C440_10318 [Haloferax mucosum ATCC BAA-1512]